MLNGVEIPLDLDPFFSSYESKKVEDCCTFTSCFRNCIDEKIYQVSTLTLVFNCLSGIADLRNRITKYINKRKETNPDVSVDKIIEELVSPEAPTTLQIAPAAIPAYISARVIIDAIKKCLIGILGARVTDIIKCAAICAYDECQFNGHICEKGSVCIKTTCKETFSGGSGMVFFESITKEECHTCWGDLNVNDGINSSTSSSFDFPLQINVDNSLIESNLSCLSNEAIEEFSKPWTLCYCLNTTCNSNSDFVEELFSFNPYEIDLGVNRKYSAEDIFSILNYSIDDQICISLKPPQSLPERWSSCEKEHCFFVECPAFAMSTLNGELILTTEKLNPLLWGASDLYVELWKKPPSNSSNSSDDYEFIISSLISSNGDMELLPTNLFGTLEEGCYNIKIAPIDLESEDDPTPIKTLCANNDFLLDQDYCVDECETLKLDFDIEARFTYRVSDNELIARRIKFTNPRGGVDGVPYQICPETNYPTVGAFGNATFANTHSSWLSAGEYCFQIKQGDCISDIPKCFNLASCEADQKDLNNTDDTNFRKESKQNKSLNECIPYAINSLNPTGPQSVDGSISLTIDGIQPGATNPYLVDWGHGDGSSSTYEQTNLLPGEYCFTIYDPNCCEAEGNGETCCSAYDCFTLEVNCPEIVLPTYEITQSYCNQSNSITFQETIPTGGTAPYQFNWNNNDTGTLNNSFEGGPGSSYRLTVTDANGCTLIERFNISEEPGLPLITNIETSGVLCGTGNPNPLYEIEYFQGEMNPDYEYGIDFSIDGSDLVPLITITEEGTGNLIRPWGFLPGFPDDTPYIFTPFIVNNQGERCNGTPTTVPAPERVEINDDFFTTTTIELVKGDPASCNSIDEYSLCGNCGSEQGCIIRGVNGFYEEVPPGKYNFTLGLFVNSPRTYNILPMLDEDRFCTEGLFNNTTISVAFEPTTSLTVGNENWTDGEGCNCFDFVLDFDSGVPPNTSISLTDPTNSSNQGASFSQTGDHSATICIENPGDYCVTVIDDYGCTQNYCTYLEPREVDVWHFAYDDNVDPLNSDGRFVAAFPSSSLPVTWDAGQFTSSLVDNGAGYFILEGLPAGDYSFTVTDANLCF